MCGTGPGTGISYAYIHIYTHIQIYKNRIGVGRTDQSFHIFFVSITLIKIFLFQREASSASVSRILGESYERSRAASFSFSSPLFYFFSSFLYFFILFCFSFYFSFSRGCGKSSLGDFPRARQDKQREEPGGSEGAREGLCEKCDLSARKTVVKTTKLFNAPA